FETLRYRNCKWTVEPMWEMTPSALWHIGAGIKGLYEKQRYINPESIMEYISIAPKVSGGVNVSDFHADATLGYGFSPYGNLSLDPGLEKEGRTMLMNNVVIPDYAFHRTDAIFFTLDAEYDFHIKKGFIGITLNGGIMAPTAKHSGYDTLNISGCRFSVSGGLVLKL
ncbi:MAG: hypothetical protein HUJ95_00275, partial [Bacteroidales bacterium]|nr:hypothetical protein [Bacteroidales bacterium]